MFGAYRLVLAVLVAVSHIVWPEFRFNPGVFAVVNFYVLSGFVMTALARRYYVGIGRPTLGFYADRALRILPQYLLFAGATLLLHQALGFRTRYLIFPPDARGLLANLSIVPLNFYMFDERIFGFMLIPPGWSLGAEVQFYLLLPLLLFLPHARPAAIVASLAVFAAAMFAWIEPDWFGYRLLPGVLFMFLTGSLLFDATRSRGARRGTIAVYAAVVLLALAALAQNSLRHEHVAEVVAGFVVAVPCVLLLSKRASTRLDEILGRGSYGTFLAHFLVLWLLQSTRVLVGRPAAFAVLATALAVLAGFAGYVLVERPVIAARRRLRARIAPARG